MDLKHLRYFVAVAEELHFTRAAERLHISQPPLSQIINRLETALGFKLLDRTKRKVILTEAGKILLQESRAILARTEQAVRQAERASRGDVGQLKVAFVPWADYTTAFFDIFRTYGDRFPEVTIDFHSMSAPAALAALNEGRIDVAFLAVSAITGVPRGFDHEVVLDDFIKVALPAGHALAELECDALQVCGGRLYDELADLRRSGKRNLVDPGVVHESRAGISEAGDDIALQSSKKS